MKFSDFIGSNQVRRAQIDIALAKSLVRTAEIDLKFVISLEVTEVSARKILTNYYDVLRSMLEAMAASEGYKVYSHEAFAFFLKEKNENILAEKFDRFRKIRNGINYYGRSITVEEAKEHAHEIAQVIDTLRSKFLKEFKTSHEP